MCNKLCGQKELRKPLDEADIGSFSLNASTWDRRPHDSVFGPTEESRHLLAAGCSQRRRFWQARGR